MERKMKKKDTTTFRNVCVARNNGYWKYNNGLLLQYKGKTPEVKDRELSLTKD